MRDRIIIPLGLTNTYHKIIYSLLKKFLVFILICISLNTYSQNEISLNGKVLNSENDTSNILVINLNSNKTTITDYKGKFIIEAKVNDTIQLIAFQFISKKIIVNDSMFKQKKIIVQLKEKVIELDEVTILPHNLSGNLTYDSKSIKLRPKVTASSLGLPNADVKPLTQNKRLLAEADSGKWIYFFQKDSIYYYRPTIIINLHKIINRVSGRTRNMRDRVSFDKELKITEEIKSIFSEQTLSVEFNIPKEEIKLFLNYCEEQSDFSRLSENKNPFEIWEYFKKKSIAFREL
ncbi:MAG: carboxypeptidase-like regulatory domain-containing protein [Flavobacteriaceae bacterium]|nr:carboxypeptidase-like regulatory domain-containing protein [Flavobacteriaceae bacterium]